jgi:hypothetical protein
LTTADEKWNYSRPFMACDPEQGWKLHVSATVLTAGDTLRKVAPLLSDKATLFKAPHSLQELIRINSGVYYGYSQVGKCITVYPRNDEEAVYLARRLCELTWGMPAPTVPFDKRISQDCCVYYRYGAFRSMDILDPDGTLTPAIRDPEGNLVPDLRESEAAGPDWAPDIFMGEPYELKQVAIHSPLRTTYRAFQALSQRGKGGVYKAIDVGGARPRLSILKEGRRTGEVNWDGRDGYWMVRNEERALTRLKLAGVDVPRVRGSFELAGNYYLVIEFIRGQNLQTLLRTRRRRMHLRQVLSIGLKLSLVVAEIHEAGWVWRDCKPSNLILTKRGELRPIDFEGACPANRPDLLLWGTPEFSPPDPQAAHPARSSKHDDVYSVGAITYFLLTGKMPAPPVPLPIPTLRRGVPPFMCELIMTLLSPDARQRPTARAAAEMFEVGLSRVGGRSGAVGSHTSVLSG